MCPVAAQRERRGIDPFYSAKGISLDTRNLHKAANRIASHAEMVFDADFSSILYL